MMIYDFKTILINSDFKIGFPIKRDVLYKKLLGLKNSMFIYSV